MRQVTRRPVFLLFFAALGALAACGGAAESERPAVLPKERAAVAPPSAPAAQPDAPSIVFLGDSLTAGLGLDVPDSFPSVIQSKLDAAGYRYRTVNAGVSGDTSAGGLRRLEWALSEGTPKVLIVALGGNDGLRGLPPEQLQQNLSAIIEKAAARGLAVILAGMEAPPNFGADYTARFRAVYPTLATRYSVPLVPFLLDGVAGDPSLNQADGIHPNPRGARIVADLVWRTLEPELARARTTTAR
jgi:acyl-CoA thioesterase I